MAGHESITARQSRCCVAKPNLLPSALKRSKRYRTATHRKGVTRRSAWASRGRKSAKNGGGPFLADCTDGMHRAIPKITAGNMMAVSLLSNAARYNPADPISQSDEVLETEDVRGLGDFLCSTSGLAEMNSAYLRYMRSAPSSPAAMSGSGTVTQLTDSVCAG